MNPTDDSVDPYRPRSESPHPDGPAADGPVPAATPIPFPQPQFSQAQFPQPQSPQPGYPPAGYPTPGQQSPYGQQPYPQGYPGEGEFGIVTPYYTGSMERPRKVTVAAVLAFVSAGLTILVLTLVLTADNVVFSTFGQALFYLTIPICIAYVWGGVLALSGKDGKLLVVGAYASIIGSVLTLVTSIAQQDEIPPSTATSVVLPIIVITRLMHPTVRDWFRAKNASTF